RRRRLGRALGDRDHQQPDLGRPDHRQADLAGRVGPRRCPRGHPGAMRPVSERFLRTVRGSHTMIARARVPGTISYIGVDPPGTETPIRAGNVVLDATADIRATLDLTTPGPWPTTPTGLLTPYGTEVFIERGIDYGDGIREWVSQGYFRLYQVEQD